MPKLVPKRKTLRLPFLVRACVNAAGRLHTFLEKLNPQPIATMTLSLSGFVLALPPARSACPIFGNRECSGHGDCLGKSGVCRCHAGYERTDCSYANFCEDDCNHHGTCVFSSDKERNPLALGQCVCSQGFGGRTCETALVIASDVSAGVALDGCRAHCSGHGRCSCGSARKVNQTRRVRVYDQRGHAAQDTLLTEEVRVNVYGARISSELTCACECHSGFEGTECSKVAGASTMVNTVGTMRVSTAVTAAAPGAACPEGCSGRGSCGTDGRCTCHSGFEGDACHRVVATICPAACSGHGTCHVRSRTCACHTGFEGVDCSTLSARGTSLSLIRGATVAAAAGGTAGTAGTAAVTCEDGCSGHGLCGPGGICMCQGTLPAPTSPRSACQPHSPAHPREPT